jgi:hypothetical protein
VKPKSCQFLAPSALNMTTFSTIESKVVLFEVSLCKTGSILVCAQYFRLAMGRMFSMFVIIKEKSFTGCTGFDPDIEFYEGGSRSLAISLIVLR